MDWLEDFLGELWPKVGVLIAVVIFVLGVLLLFQVLGSGGAASVQNAVGTAAPTLALP